MESYLSIYKATNIDEATLCLFEFYYSDGYYY